ncbi:MAG: hypothetical protein JST38_20860 [Bacteroidetes bacterium]|nr:hypothetical protein [Bacteroidota bacterium]
MYQVAETITDTQLLSFIRADRVKKIILTENENGRYEVSVSLTWDLHEYAVVTVRGKRREWASLDRMQNHLKKSIKGINFTLSIESISIPLNHPTERKPENVHPTESSLRSERN